LEASQKELITLASETLKGWNVNSSIHTVKEATKEDDCDVTGRKVAVDLRQMEKVQRIIAEKIIGEVLFYGKSGLLQMNNSFMPQPPPLPMAPQSNVTNPHHSNLPFHRSQENVANPQPPFYQSQRATSGQNSPYDDGCSSQELTELGPIITFKNQ
jgi:hypothetical protein